MMLALGVDGGQSSTRTFLARDDGRILGAYRTGPCNHIHEAGGLERQFVALRDGRAGAFAVAGLEAQEVDAACLGLTGRGHLPTVRRAIPAGRLRLIGDVEAAFAGAIPAGVGVVVIAGTGSIAWGRDAHGATHRTGGWGFLAGDEGSAYDVGRQAFGAVYRAHDGRGPRTELATRLCSHFGVTGLDALRDALYAAATTRADIAACARVVADAARDGDAVAQDLLRAAGTALAELAAGVLDHLDASAARRVVPIGGMTSAGELLVGSFREALAARHPAVEIKGPRLDPSRGALVVALQELGATASASVLKNLREPVRLHDVGSFPSGPTSTGS